MEINTALIYVTRCACPWRFPSTSKNRIGTAPACTSEIPPCGARRCCQSMAASACRMISRSSFPDREVFG
jgi:hypothetical protein